MRFLVPSAQPRFQISGELHRMEIFMSSSSSTYQSRDPAERFIGICLCGMTLYFIYRIVPLAAEWVIGNIQAYYRDWLTVPYSMRVGAGVTAFIGLCYAAVKVLQSGYKRADQFATSLRTAYQSTNCRADALEGSLSNQGYGISRLEARVTALEEALQMLSSPDASSKVIESPQAAMEKLSQEFIHE